FLCSLPLASSFFFTILPQPRSTLFPYTTLFRSLRDLVERPENLARLDTAYPLGTAVVEIAGETDAEKRRALNSFGELAAELALADRKSTRLNSSHQIISYAVFCLKKKTKVHDIR